MNRRIVRRTVKRTLILRHPAPAPAGATGDPTRAAANAITVANDAFDSFNPSRLGLGSINVPSAEMDAVAAIFDLSGFTKFCNQVDPHLAVPAFLSQFLDWLFGKIKNGVLARSYTEHKALWAELPFQCKFLGDGVMFLWNTKDLDEIRICNIVSILYDICYSYQAVFCPYIRKQTPNPPGILRCGVARGKVFSVGNGHDYIGHCINLASRLQKLSLLSFCFARRGFDVQNYMTGTLREKVIEKRVNIRGILQTDLVWVLKDEFDRLPDREKQLFGQA